MKNRDRVLRGLAIVATVGLGSYASAHLLDVEEEAYEAHPWQVDQGDSSFANPHVLQFGLLDSQAIFAWLDADDVDVYQFTVTPDDVAQAQGLGLPVPFAFAAAIPPACAQTKNNYPAIALIAPFGTAPVQSPGLFELPFAVPPGHGVLPVYNTPAADGEERPIFYLPPEDTEEPLNLSWFLPNGCVTEPHFDCSQSDSLAAPIFVPGTTAYLAVWDPDGVPQDYTVNLGIDESAFQHFEEIEDFVRDNGHLHGPCTEPYPGN